MSGQCSCISEGCSFTRLHIIYSARRCAGQGGRFDHADRLFSSVPATWNNCLVNTSDVKELTPEFFYLPDFLTNADGFCLGTRQVCTLFPFLRGLHLRMT